MITHPIEPIFDENARILILGSFPSRKSREEMFFYGHPQNRFWRVVATVFEQETPTTVEEKRCFLLANNVALWDVIASCDITGSADSSIRNVVANDLRKILSVAEIRQIFVNGRTAEKYYKKYVERVIGREAICLPSTSPANAAWSVDGLVSAWRQIKQDAL